MSFYLIDKEKGWTSFDVVAKLRNTTNSKKAGHSGTLDPFATGLLIVATNGDTKFLNRLLKERKKYEGEFFFGEQTDTLDPTGKIVLKKDVSIREVDLKNLISKKYIGNIHQIPPIFSAIKINGKKAYEYARKQKQVILKPVKRMIFSFEVKEISPNKFWFSVEVSSGTFIRSLARDIGVDLNSPCMLTDLKRTSIGSYKLDQATNLVDLNPISTNEFLGIKTIMISEEMIKNALEAKELYFENTEDEIIVQNNNIRILLNKVSPKYYKIKKRLK